MFASIVEFVATTGASAWAGVTMAGSQRRDLDDMDSLDVLAQDALHLLDLGLDLGIVHAGDVASGNLLAEEPVLAVDAMIDVLDLDGGHRYPPFGSWCSVEHRWRITHAPPLLDPTDQAT